MKSPVLRAFPWYTGVVSKLPNFFGKFSADNLMKVRQNLIRTHSSMTDSKLGLSFHPWQMQDNYPLHNGPLWKSPRLRCPIHAGNQGHNRQYEANGIFWAECFAGTVGSSACRVAVFDPGEVSSRWCGCVYGRSVSLPNAYTEVTRTNRLHPSMSIFESFFTVLHSKIDSVLMDWGIG
jgi:hypothetical protein